MGREEQRDDASALARQRVDDGNRLAPLALAVEAEDWTLVADTIEADWPRLFMQHQDLLREAYAATPPAAFRRHPAARAVREMLFPVAPAVPESPPAELPDDPDTLAELATGPQALEVLLTGLAGMVAMRLREEWGRARHQADRLGVVLELAHRERFDEIAYRIPSTEFQLGMTHLMAGEPVGALRHLQRAHRNADLDEIGYIARDSAAKLALIHAARGDTVAAADWMKASDEAAIADISLSDQVESSRLTARALIAVAQVDRDEAARVRDEMGGSLIEEELWALRLHALVRVGLLLGDVLGVQRLIEETNAALPYARQPSPPLRDLLLTDSADLLMALGSGTRARLLLADAESNAPIVELCRGRLALLTDSDDTALQYATTVLGADRINSRIESEALVLAAVAHERLGRRADAESNLRLALIRAAATGSVAGLATVPGPELTKLADVAGDDLPDGLPEMFGDEVIMVDLTDREKQMLAHIAAGRTIASIADSDYVSVNTVKSHIRSLYRKLGVNRRPDALEAARAHGIISDYSSLPG